MTGAKLRFAVVVSDSHGVPIRDLHSDDFVIEIAGKLQAGQVQSADPATPPASSSSANHGRGLVVVVIDTIHTSWAEQRDLRLDAEKYLAACAKRDLPVSLLVLNQDGTLNAVHEYTTNSTTLTAALEQADAEMHQRTLAASVSPEVAREAGRLLDFYKGVGNFPSGRPTKAYPGVILTGLRTLASYVANIPGRKSLIWINSIVPFAVDEKLGRIDSPSGFANRNVLTGDQVSQLQVMWKDSIGAVQRSELALFPVLTRHLANLPMDPEVIHSMESLAHMTGGQEVHSVGDAFAQLLDLQESNIAAYEIVLSGESARECKSDWCELKIAVNRSGAHVLAPHGFFREASLVQPETSVARLSTEPDPGPNPIPFTVSWKPAEGTETKKKIAFVVKFGPATDIPADGSTELNLEVTVHAISNRIDKQAIDFGAKTQLPSGTLNEIRAKGFVLNNAIELEPGEYDVRFVVQDKISGRSGILSVPLKVP